MKIFQTNLNILHSLGIYTIHKYLLTKKNCEVITEQPVHIEQQHFSFDAQTTKTVSCLVL